MIFPTISIRVICINLLSFDSGNAGEDFAFDGFEECATAGGDITYAVCQAELVDTSHAVAAADERVSAVVGSQMPFLPK